MLGATEIAGCHYWETVVFSVFQQDVNCFISLRGASKFAERVTCFCATIIVSDFGIIIVNMQNSPGFHQDVATHLKVSTPENVEKLVRHIFKNTPHIKYQVEKYFPTQKFLTEELPPAEPQNLLFRPPF